MVCVTNKINYYCCRIFRGATAPTAPMVLTPVCMVGFSMQFVCLSVRPLFKMYMMYVYFPIFCLFVFSV